MSSDADVETAKLKVAEPVPSYQGRRILPEETAPVRAWTDNDEYRPLDTRSPTENKQLLPNKPPKKSRVQAGVTLGVLAHAKYTKCPQFPKSQKERPQTKFQKKIKAPCLKLCVKLKTVLKPPYLILVIIMIMVFIHVLGSSNLSAILEWTPENWRRQPWRLFTYGCVHASYRHLALNALMALAVGWALEREQGWWRVLAVWCGGVAAGALGAGALQPHVRVVGASAAVYALLTAHLANVCLRFGHIPLWWFRPLSVLVLGASEGSWALLHASPGRAVPPAAHAHPDATIEHVAWGAHALGAAVGVPLAFLIFTGERKNERYVFICRIISGVLLAAGVVLAIEYYNYWYTKHQNVRP